jgi:UDP-N-acetylglucosamine 3-dehydrogenase
MGLRVGIVGCGRPRGAAGATGMGMANRHALGYASSADTELVALCDLDPDAALAFQAEHGGTNIYQDYQTMLSEERLDIVSVCTPPNSHAAIVMAAATAGVQAIHCEKPMAASYGDALRMAEACNAHGVQLTINHQRRFGMPFVQARELIRSGAIGRLTDLQGICGDLQGWGTHWYDMLFFLNDETPVDWLIGQIEPRGGRVSRGIPTEGQSVSQFKFQNDVRGLLLTGFEASLGGSDKTREHIRCIGTEGMIEILAYPGASLRLWNAGQAGWQTLDVAEGNDSPEYTRRAVLDLLAALASGREPELSASRALKATELIFATYESSRRRARIDMPLQCDESPFQAMIASGDITL